MPFIYKPFRQTMSPNNTTLDPTIANTFYININGQVCNGYRFRIFDMNSTLIPSASTDLVPLVSPLYDGDTLEIVVGANVLTAGNQYKWQVDLYSTFLGVSAVSTVNDTLTSANHNLLTGDIIFIQSTGNLPTSFNHHEDWLTATIYAIGDMVYYIPNTTYYKCILGHTSSGSILPTNVTYWEALAAEGLTEYAKYYMRVVDKDTISLFENTEASKNNAGIIDITSEGTGTITISNISTSDEMPFNVFDVPTVSLTVGTLTSQSNEFVPSYSHPQGVLINKFQAFLYNASGVLLDSSDIIYSSNARYTFDGFLSGSTYGVKFIITNNAEQISDTGITYFAVSYSAPSILITATAENIYQDSCIKISWANLVQIVGNPTGTYSYIENYLTYEGYGLQLDINSTLDYAGLVMALGGTLPIFIWQPLDISFTGIIAEFENTDTSDNIKIYYDGSKFYQDRNGVILNNLPLSLTADSAYLIAIIGQELFTNLIGTYVVPV